MRIVLCYPVEPRHVAQIAAAAPGHEIVDAGQARIAEELHAADIFCGHAKVPVDWDAVVARGRLRWIQSSAAGLDHCLVPSVVASDIVVTSASGVLANQVAEHALGLALALCRSLPVFFRAQQQKDFTRRPTRDLHHGTVGIVGFGGVGRRLAELLAPFQVRILATDLFPRDKPGHFVFLAVPLTPQTRGMLNRQTLARMKPDSFLVNVARGGLLIEADLLAALDSGHLAGAALDVTAVEPLPAESPLWDHPRVILTPHVAGQSARRIDNMTDFFCDNLRRYLAGGELRNLVDKRLGFPRPAGPHPQALFTKPPRPA
jgi:D-3-phosphoglycerate dehydrogenase